jgi:hypothetical protein
MMIAIDVSCGETDLSPMTAALQPPTALRDEFPAKKDPSEIDGSFLQPPTYKREA